MIKTFENWSNDQNAIVIITKAFLINLIDKYMPDMEFKFDSSDIEWETTKFGDEISCVINVQISEIDDYDFEHEEDEEDYDDEYDEEDLQHVIYFFKRTVQYSDRNKEPNLIVKDIDHFVKNIIGVECSISFEGDPSEEDLLKLLKQTIYQIKHPNVDKSYYDLGFFD